MLGICQPAHAGMLGWMDRTFTFRQEQKPLIAPTRNAVPSHVIQPSYSPSDHVTWSDFYTRKDLTPQDYLSSSASKVMRPPVPVEPLPAQPSPTTAGTDDLHAGDPLADTSGNVSIGEPGQGPGMASGNSSVGRATQIGAAKNDWRNRDGSDGLASRPGDFDYHLHDVDDREPMEADGNIIGEALPPKTAAASSSASSSTVPEALRNDPRYVDFNGSGQVSQYAVQPGDTLGGIAAQPAIYDKASLWPLIYSANRSDIGGKPSNLKKGQKLVIPRDYTDAQAKDAEARAARH